MGWILEKTRVTRYAFEQNGSMGLSFSTKRGYIGTGLSLIEQNGGTGLGFRKKWGYIGFEV